MFCIHCGKQINEGDRFCEFCGGQQAIAPEPAAQPQPAAQPVQPAVQPQPAAQPVQPAVQPQPQAVQPQQQVVYTTQPQTAGTQPQVVYVQQPVQQAAPEPAPAPKKKKPPIALFVILGVLLTFGIIAAIIIAIVVFGVVKVGKVAKEKVADYGKTQMESYMEDNGFVPKASESDNSEKDTGSGKTEDSSQDENGDIGQFGDGEDIGQFGDNTMTWESLDNPTLDDFNWIKAADTIYSDSSVKWLDSSQYQGAWKGMIIYSADGSEELVNFNLDVNSQNVTLLADWYMVHIGGNEMLPEDDVDDVLFTGYEWGSGIHVEAGTATIEIEEFWEIGGSQYAKGVIKLENAADSEVWLVRP